MDEQHGRSVSKGSPSGVGRLADFATRSLADLETSAVGKPASGRPLVVAADGSGDVRTVAEGVQLGGQGAKLLVKPGTYREALELMDDVDVEGLGEPSAVVIAGPGDQPTISVKDGRHSIRRLTISGGRHGDFAAEISGVAAVEVTNGALRVEDVAFTDCPGVCVSASSKYASVEMRDCMFEIGHGWLLELGDAVGGTIERCIIEGGPGGSEPLVRFSGHQTDVVFRGNTLRRGGILLQSMRRR